MPRPFCRRPIPAGAAAVAAGLGAALALAGCDGPAPRDSRVATVTVGLLAGEVGTGPGLDAVRGTQLAAELVNGSHPDLTLPLAAPAGLPGLGGADLAVVVADSAGEPAAADIAMDELLSAGVVGVVAADRAGVVEIAGAYADRRELPMVDGATTAEFLLDIGLDWYFRTGPTDRMLTEALFSLFPAPGSEPGHRLTVLTPAEDRGADVASLLAEQAETAGYEVTDVLTADQLTADPAAGQPPVEDPAFEQAATHILVAVAPAPGDGQALHQAVEQWQPPVPAFPGIDQAPPVTLVAGLGQGFTDTHDQMRPAMVHAGGWSAELAGRQPLALAVAARYETRFGTPMTGSAAQAFTAALALAAAIDAAGSAEPAAIRTALRQLSIPATQTIMPWNGIRFGETGQNELAAAIVEQVGDGDGPADLVFPPELAAVDLVWEGSA